MFREIAVSIYLTCFRIFFLIFNLMDTRNKTTFVVSFGGNVTSTLHSLEKLVDDQQIVILKTAGCKVDFAQGNRIVLYFTPKNIIQFIQSIYHIATSDHVIVDNYYAFLSVTNFKSSVKCIQLWHAAGAIKKFGLEDLTNKKRTKRTLHRFNSVYNRFDHVVVGSNRMADIFKQSFGLSEDRFIYSGIPRTDFFYDSKRIRQAKREIEYDFPSIINKKVLLYAPTYRDDELKSTQLRIDLDIMYQQFNHNHVLFLRLHPAVALEFENKYPGFVFNVSDYHSINHLLVIADILITDYSSIPFEFALLNKPMIFYMYDYEDYKQSRGISMEDLSEFPGAITASTEELVQVIVNENFRTELIQPFSNEWNMFSKGNSSDTLIYTLYANNLIKSERKVREHA